MNPAVSRRKFIALGSAGLIMMAPGVWSLSRATVGPTFDYYISPTGNDANAGTVASPWAITSARYGSANFTKTYGKRVGFMPGTYNVAAYMQKDSSTGALQIPGGTAASPTYWASCDASGNYSPLTATITALAGGVYGGIPGTTYNGRNGPVIANTKSNYPSGNFTIDGIVLSGFAYKGIRVGGGSSGDGPSNVAGVTIKNCLFTGGSCIGNATDNCFAVWLDYTLGAVVFNNKFLNNLGFANGSCDHLAAVGTWGAQGSQISFNTMQNAGYIWGKENANQGNNVFNNFIDVSMYTGQSSANGLQDFTGATATGLTQTTNIHHNIILSSSFGLGYYGLNQADGWTTPVNFYSNTIVMVQTGGQIIEAAIWMYSEVAKNVTLHSNLVTGAVSGDYRMFRFNAGGLLQWDYNLFPANATWDLLANGAGGVYNSPAYGTLASIQAAVAAAGFSGFEAHGVQNSNPQFVGGSPSSPAAAYQLQSGSPARGKGKGGIDIGAWDGTVTQIGCAAAVVATVAPRPPSNVTVS
jgi:hypothetical protein